eukprot:g42565.t1
MGTIEGNASRQPNSDCRDTSRRGREISIMPDISILGAGAAVATNIAAGGALVMVPNKVAKAAGAYLLFPGPHYAAVAAAGSALQSVLAGPGSIEAITAVATSAT